MPTKAKPSKATRGNARAAAKTQQAAENAISKAVSVKANTSSQPDTPDPEFKYLSPPLPTSQVPAKSKSPSPPPQAPVKSKSPPPSQQQEDNEDVDEDEEEVGADGKKLPRMTWSLKMKEQLVETLHETFIQGGAADNSFKKSTFEKAAEHVRRVYHGPHEITWLKCKNHWADLKKKWGWWVILSNQSGAGFNEDTELYDFYDYVWNSLNHQHPGLIWHKTHVMPLRDLISHIQQDVQANGEGALALEDPTPIDPRLASLNTSGPSGSSSPAPANVPKTSKTLYNKLKRKAIKVDDDDLTENTPVAKKVDLGTALIGYTKELTVQRKAKEAHLTVQQRAIQLLENEYKERLEMMAFIDGVTWLQDEQNATAFITLIDKTYRDRMLEIKLSTELLNKSLT